MAGKITVVLLCTISLLLSALTGKAQDRCSIIKYEQFRHSTKLKRETKDQFEQWMQSNLSPGGTKAFATLSATYTIPVVVHIIHNGASDPTNISDAQINSQIDVINADFNRLNVDASNTPGEFLGVAGNIDIEFVLAKQDPEGLPTNGITRTLATKPSWVLADDYDFKALSYWPAENYLNIWVVNFGSEDIIGYAQFPISGLPGLGGASQDRLTDGIVTDYRAFGTGAFNLFPRFNKGRTATHELGHFFGLRHIWGDGSCADDYVSDTPKQSGATTFCPSPPQAGGCSPPGNKMFMNYMDYTDDACMNVISDGQVGRMQVVLGSSPRRASLTSSPGAYDPVLVTHDLGIRNILSPTSSSCASPIVPQIEVRNYGSINITTADVQLLVNSVPMETKTFPMSLGPGSILTLSFGPLNFPPSNQQVSFQILQSNGTVDENPANDSKAVTVSIPGTGILPVIADNWLPGSWTVYNPDGLTSWTTPSTPAPNFSTASMNFYDYQNPGAQDWLITPAFTVTDPTLGQLRFDVAYAQYPGETGDALRVYALPACNRDLSQAILLYEKSGSALATAPTTSSPFTPNGTSQWRKSEVLSLFSLNNSIAWQLAFVGRNGYGNNLYIDNVKVTDDEITDIAMAGIVSPGLVHCVESPPFLVNVVNNGTTTVYNFHLEYTLDGAQSVPTDFTNLQMAPGGQYAFNLPSPDLKNGVNSILITISNPNGITDISTNNQITFTTFLDKSIDTGPLRMTFDNPEEIPWLIASPSNAQDWEAITTNKDQSIIYRSFINAQAGDESWLVSPVLDLSAGPFSLFFDVSYAQNTPADDRLQILASTDCGVTYDEVIMDRAASTFSLTDSSIEWYPGTNEDWKTEYAGIPSLAGKKDVRLAFVVQNDNGNNLFIDNIELFAGDNPNPPTTTVPYQLYFSSINSNSDLAITFNLPTKEDVQLQIYSMQGSLVASMILPDTLNQTYYYDFSSQTSGIYLFRLVIDNQPSVTKVFIGH